MREREGESVRPAMAARRPITSDGVEVGHAHGAVAFGKADAGFVANQRQMGEFRRSEA